MGHYRIIGAGTLAIEAALSGSNWAGGLVNDVGGSRYAITGPALYGAKTRRAMRSKYRPHYGAKELGRAHAVA